MRTAHTLLLIPTFLLLAIQLPLAVDGAVTEFRARDPDNADAVFSTGDVLTITFSPALPDPLPDVSSRESIRAALTFTQSLGANFTGSWTSSGGGSDAATSNSVLEIVSLNATGSAVSELFGATNAPVAPRLRATAVTDGPLDGQGTTPELLGDFGTAAGPNLVSVAYSGSVLENSTAAVAVLTFSEATNVPSASAGTEVERFVFFYVDTNGGADLEQTQLRPALLRNITGTWTSATELRVTFAAAKSSEETIAAGSLFPEIRGYIRNAAQTTRYTRFDPAVAASLQGLGLSGRFDTEKTSVVTDGNDDPELFMMLVVAFGGLGICVLCGGGCALAVRRRNRRRDAEAKPIMGDRHNHPNTGVSQEGPSYKIPPKPRNVPAKGHGGGDDGGVNTRIAALPDGSQPDPASQHTGRRGGRRSRDRDRDRDRDLDRDLDRNGGGDGHAGDEGWNEAGGGGDGGSFGGGSDRGSNRWSDSDLDFDNGDFFDDMAEAERGYGSAGSFGSRGSGSFRSWG